MVVGFNLFSLKKDIFVYKQQLGIVTTSVFREMEKGKMVYV